MAVPPETAPKCPQCQYPVTKNATTCPGCNVFYHEVCLRRGCSCGGGTAARGKPNLLLAAEFALGLAGLGAGAWQRGAAVSSAPLFVPAVALGVVGFLAAATRKLEDPQEAARGHTAAQLLFIPVVAALVVAAKGGEFPYFIAAVVLGALGLAKAVFAFLGDADRSNAMLAILVAAHAYMVAGVVLTPQFGMKAVDQVKAIASGKLKLTAPLSAPTPAKTDTGFKVSGVMNVGGSRKALTPLGAFGPGQSIPGIGTVVSVTDAEVVVQGLSGGQDRYPVPR